MMIFLIRHGESIKLTDNNVTGLPDHKAYLSCDGIKQSLESGNFLQKYLIDNKINIDNAIVWVSPFLNARESSQIINEKIGVSNVKEDYALIEQRRGLFTNNSVGRNKLIHENEFKFYDNYYQNDGEFYAKLPQGESPMDVAIRTRQFLDMVSRKNNNPVFVISHAVTIKTIVMNTFNFSPEWFNVEPIMENGAIRLIDTDTNKDEYIYGGPVKKITY